MARESIPVLAVLAFAVAAHLWAAPIGLDFEFERYNGIYEDLEAEVEPIRSGPVTIRLSSPEHRLELHSHAVRLERAVDGFHDLKMTARFVGAGSLIAELDFGGIPASLEDQVEFPLQSAELEAKVSIEIVDEGYRVTAEELPSFVEVEMKSRLGRELVTWCERLSLFLVGDAGCSELDEQLSSPRLPLPAPGTSFIVQSEDLTADERSRIDVYLASF